MFPHAQIRHDVTLPGLKSRTARQIDLLIDAAVAGFSITIAIDCKYFSRKVDVKHVEEAVQSTNVYSYYADPRVQLEVRIRDDGRTVVRTLEASEIPDTAECTLFVDFEAAVLYLNLMSPTKDSQF